MCGMVGVFARYQMHIFSDKLSGDISTRRWFQQVVRASHMYSGHFLNIGVSNNTQKTSLTSHEVNNS